MATRYRDSRNKNAVADGDAFEVYILNELARQGRRCYRCITLEKQLEIGDLEDACGIGYEVKLDQRCTDTGRLSIEIAEKTAVDRPWVDSGIFASSRAEYYIQGNTHQYWIFHRVDLQNWYRAHHPRVYDDAPPTIKKFYIPIDPMPVATVNMNIDWAARKQRARDYLKTRKQVWRSFVDIYGKEVKVLTDVTEYPYQQEPE